MAQPAQSNPSRQLDQTPAAAPVAPGGDGPAGQLNSSGKGKAAAPQHTPAGPHLHIHVIGVPAPQGSKRGFVAGGRAIIVDDNKPRLRTWREDVKHAALGALPEPWQPLLEPVELDVTFLMPRPKHHFRTGRNAHLLRNNAPTVPAGKPDVDKLLRSSLDALTAAGLYRDDSQVVTLTGRKVYATSHPGALINVYVSGAAA